MGQCQQVLCQDHAGGRLAANGMSVPAQRGTFYIRHQQSPWHDQSHGFPCIAVQQDGARHIHDAEISWCQADRGREAGAGLRLATRQSRQRGTSLKSGMQNIVVLPVLHDVMASAQIADRVRMAVAQQEGTEMIGRHACFKITGISRDGWRGGKQGRQKACPCVHACTEWVARGVA